MMICAWSCSTAVIMRCKAQRRPAKNRLEYFGLLGVKASHNLVWAAGLPTFAAKGSRATGSEETGENLGISESGAMTRGRFTSPVAGAGCCATGCNSDSVARRFNRGS